MKPIRFTVASRRTLFSLISLTAISLFATPRVEHFGGIGANIAFINDTCRVVSAVEYEPADLAGLRAGDKIISVDGLGATGYSQGDVAGFIRGEAGSKVTLQIVRGDEIEEVVLWRARYIVRTLNSEKVSKRQPCLDSTLVSCRSYEEHIKEQLGAGSNARIFGDGHPLSEIAAEMKGSIKRFQSLEIDYSFSHPELQVSRCDKKSSIELTGQGSWYLALVGANGRTIWSSSGGSGTSVVQLPPEIVQKLPIAWCRVWQEGQR